MVCFNTVCCDSPCRELSLSCATILRSQKDGTDGAVDHSSFTGLLSQGRGLVATAGSLTGSLTAGGDDALLLSPRRPRRPGGNDLCFSPVLLSRRGERNLIMGNPLDVQMPGASTAPHALGQPSYAAVLSYNSVGLLIPNHCLAVCGTSRSMSEEKKGFRA